MAISCLELSNESPRNREFFFFPYVKSEGFCVFLEGKNGVNWDIRVSLYDTTRVKMLESKKTGKKKCFKSLL